MYKDELQTVVIDNGTDYMKVGFARNDSPRAIFPTIFGHKFFRGTCMRWMGLRVAGYVAQRKARESTIHYPIEQGIVTNWDEMECIWYHTFHNELRVAPEECIVLHTEAVHNPKANKEKMTEIMFESFKIPCLHQCMTPLLSLYASGRITGLVIESGAGVSHVVPIFKHHPCTRAIQRHDIAGRSVTEYLMRVLCERGYSLSTAVEREVVCAIKEKFCYVIQNKDSRSPDEKHYELPDGQVVTVGGERFRCTEAIFNPSLLGMSCGGLQDYVYDAVMGCDVDLRGYLLRNILLSGGNTMFSGMRERVREEVTCLFNTDVKVTAPVERKESCWIGGSMLASMSDFYKMCISRDEYNEYGPSIVHRKCY